MMSFILFWIILATCCLRAMLTLCILPDGLKFDEGAKNTSCGSVAQSLARAVVGHSGLYQRQRILHSQAEGMLVSLFNQIMQQDDASESGR